MYLKHVHDIHTHSNTHQRPRAVSVERGRPQRSSSPYGRPSSRGGDSPANNSSQTAAHTLASQNAMIRTLQDQVCVCPSVHTCPVCLSMPVFVFVRILQDQVCVCLSVSCLSVHACLVCTRPFLVCVCLSLSVCLCLISTCGNTTKKSESICGSDFILMVHK